MTSNLCLICRRNWPIEEDYNVCPCCLEECVLDDLPAMARDDASREASHGAFGWYLWDNGLV